MSGLFGALGENTQALAAHSRSLETAGRNLANVNNPGYARQRVIYGDRGTVQTSLGAQSLGLEAKSIQQLRDPLLDQQVVRESSAQASLEAEQAGYQKAQSNLGQTIDQTGDTSSTDSGGGISEDVASLFNSFSSFAANPTDSGGREALLQNAGILTDRLHATDARLAQVQTDLTTQTTSDLRDANTTLKNIADLNAEIGRYEIGNPGSAVDLRDQRQTQLENLAKDISVESRTDPTNPSLIQVFGRDSSNNPVILVNQTSVTGNLSLSGSTISGGSPSTALVLSGGSIQGSLTARDGAVTNLRTDLNALAKQLVTAVNGAYDPGPGPSTGDFFDPTKITAANIAVLGSVNSATLKASNNLTSTGDSTIAQAVANLASQTFSVGSGDFINGTFSQSFSNTVSNLGEALSTANQQVADQTNVATLVKSQRDAVSGVSMDEEMTDMMKFQRAFQATSRVISVINDLLDNVVNLGK